MARNDSNRTVSSFHSPFPWNFFLSFSLAFVLKPPSLFPPPFLSLSHFHQPLLVIISFTTLTTTTALSQPGALCACTRTPNQTIRDRIAEQIRVKLGLSKEQLTLAQVLESATWKGGREIAREKRPESGGGPPIEIVSDGTVF